MNFNDNYLLQQIIEKKNISIQLSGMVWRSVAVNIGQKRWKSSLEKRQSRPMPSLSILNRCEKLWWSKPNDCEKRTQCV